MIFVKALGPGGDYEYWPIDYVVGVEWSEVYARLNPDNCPVIERTGDGVSVGPCCFHLKGGTECPRHGTVIKP